MRNIVKHGAWRGKGRVESRVRRIRRGWAWLAHTRNLEVKKLGQKDQFKVCWVAQTKAAGAAAQW